MSKETTILFLYDTELLKKEEDDPNSAILYFYPTWASEQQKTALCGQLIGTIICLKHLIEMPRSVSLQTGKFFLIQNGRYILVVGSDRNVPDWTLEYKATFIYSLINFFHKDFMELAKYYNNENLNAKLYQIFDTYLKLLCLGGSIFNHIPLMDLSKTENDILINNTKRFIEGCKTIPNILGGMILYYNKVVYTELSVNTSKIVVFSDPYRVKNPGEIENLQFEIPTNVKLFAVYITLDEYEDLMQKRSKFNRDTKNKSANGSELESTGNMKRNTSLIFTTVPEEESLSNEISKFRKNKKPRPNSLNLQSFSLDSSGDFSFRRRITPITPYWNQSSIPSTPLSENKSFLEQSNKFKECLGNLSFHLKESMKDYNSYLGKTEQLSMGDIPNKGAKHRRLSLPNLTEIVSITKANQYSCSTGEAKKSIPIRKWKSIHDSVFPWTKDETVALSQYYIQDVFWEQCSNIKTSSKLKKSVTLPIKFPKALTEEAFTSSLMNKLSMENEQERSAPLKNILSDQSNASEATEELNTKLRKCILFMYSSRNLSLACLLIEVTKESVFDLQKLCVDKLPNLESQMASTLEPLKSTSACSDPHTFSILNIDAEWETIKREGCWEDSDLKDLSMLHESFKSDKDLTEISLRKAECLLFGNRHESNEVFYREVAPVSKGLLGHNDSLASVSETAKKRINDQN